MKFIARLINWFKRSRQLSDSDVHLIRCYIHLHNAGFSNRQIRQWFERKGGNFNRLMEIVNA